MRKTTFIRLLRVAGTIGLVFAFAAMVQPAPARAVTSERAPALLGEGIRAARAGDMRRAQEKLTAALAEGVKNVDYVRFFLAEARLSEAGPKAALPLYETVARVKGSRFSVPAAWRAADCLWQLGQKTEAKRRYRALLQTLGETRETDAPRARIEHVDPALAHARLAEAEPPAKARDHYLRIVTHFPNHALARLAEDWLARAGSTTEGGEINTALAPPVLLARARTLIGARRFDEALATLAQLPPELPAGLSTERDLLTGKTLYQTRKHYDEAARLLGSVVDRLPAREAAWAAFHAARALARADRDDQAIAAFMNMAERFPTSIWAAEACFMAGWLALNQGRFAESVPALSACAARYPKSPFSANALWFLAFAHYLIGEIDPALAALARFEKRSDLRPELRPRERTLYFRARLLAKKGELPAATAMLTDLARAEPFEWYGLLAASQLEALGHRLPPFSETQPPVATRLLASAKVVGAQLRRDPGLMRIDELLAAHLPDDAGVELERDTTGLLARLGRSAGLAIIFDRARASDTHARAHTLASMYGKAALARPPTGVDRLIWEAAYPLAKANLVEAHGPAAGNPPHLLYAIMRKESGFDPSVVSYADARGLLQMIPSTSRQVAEEAGLPYSAAALYDPETNIALGARYIGALHRKFGAEPILTFAAYNAGPRALRRFCERFGGHPTDEFVELVTYAQTREYIKRVSANYARYRFLYEGERWLPSLSLSCRVSEDGPEY